MLNTLKNTKDGLEVYYVKGQRFSIGMIAENLQGKGIVITKYGDLNEKTLKEYYSGIVLAHEVMHSARIKEQTSSSKTVYDVYQIKKNHELSKEDIINDWGTGYYKSGTTLNNIIKKILLYGHTTNKSNGYDIPYGPIRVTNDGINFSIINCGIYSFSYKKLNIDRIFTHED